MSKFHLEICTHELPLESYVNTVLRHLNSLFDIEIYHDYGVYETRSYKEFDIFTKNNPFEIKRECMRLETQGFKRIGDIDLYHRPEHYVRGKKISRWDSSFIRWRVKNYFKKISERLFSFKNQ